MITIGITGPIGHGKSALVEYIQKAEPDSQTGESGFIISEVADHLNNALGSLAVLPSRADLPQVKLFMDAKLPEAVKAVTPLEIDSDKLVFDIDEVTNKPELHTKLWEYLDAVNERPEMLTVPITPVNKESYRPVLQWIGNTVTTKLDRSLWYEELLRRMHANTAVAPKLYILGGVRLPLDADVVHNEDGVVIEIERPGLPVRDADDPTELARQQITPDINVINDAGLPQLDNLAFWLTLDIERGKYNSVYKAKAF